MPSLPRLRAIKESMYLSLSPNKLLRVFLAASSVNPTSFTSLLTNNSRPFSLSNITLSHTRGKYPRFPAIARSLSAASLVYTPTFSASSRIPLRISLNLVATTLDSCEAVAGSTDPSTIPLAVARIVLRWSFPKERSFIVSSTSAISDALAPIAIDTSSFQRVKYVAIVLPASPYPRIIFTGAALYLANAKALV